jgi:glucokinase
LQLIVANLSGLIFEKIDLFQGKIPEPNLALRAVVDSIHDIENRYPQRQALGIGIAAPGFIDLSSGDIIVIGRVPSLKNFPICRHLRESTKLPVQIANDVDCMAIAEFHDNHERLKRNLVYIGFCEGVKASLFLNGELYKSSNGNAGLIDPGLLRSTGTLEPELNEKLLTSGGFNDVFDRLVGALTPAEQEAYRDILSLKDENEKFNAIVERATTGDPVCHPMSEDMITLLATAVANIVLTVQPDEVVIGGLLSALPKPIFRQFESALRGQIPTLISNNLLIRQGVMEHKNNAAIGAIYHFLESKLTEILSEL